MLSQQEQVETTRTNYLKKANQLEEAGKLNEAISIYKQAIELKPDNSQLYLGLAKAQTQQGDLNGAIAVYKQAIELKPDNPQLYLDLAKAQTQQGDLNGAIAAYRKAIELNVKNSFPVHKHLGDALKKQKKLDEALAAYETAKNLEPKHPGIYDCLGVTHYQQGNLEEAVAAYKKAIELAPEHAHSYRQLIQLGYIEEAFECLQQILNKEPHHILIEHFYLSHKSIIPRQYLENALEILENFARNNSGNIQILLNISIVARKLNQFKKAEVYVKKALDLEPENAMALSDMGKILEKRKDWNGAISYYRKSNLLNDKVNIIECIYKSDLSDKEEPTDREIKSIIQSSQTIEFIKREILEKKNIDYEQYLILYMHDINVGDTCKRLALIKPLCIQHGKKAIVFYPDSHSPITQARLFLDPIVPQYVANHFSIDGETQQEIERLIKEDRVSLGELPVMPGIPRMMNNDSQKQGLTYITDKSIYERGIAASLGINIELNEDTMGKPVIEKRCLTNAMDKFENLHLSRGKAILVAPHSKTMNSLTGSNAKLIPFWQKIINQLVERNVTPVINTKHREEKLSYLSKIIEDRHGQYVKMVDLPLDEVIPFVELCGAFAGIRSGLCDLIAFASPQVTKLCIQPTRSDDNCFGKIPRASVIDESIINKNFNLYFVLPNNLPDQEQIERIVELF